MAQDYRDLVVWQKAIDLTVCVYQLTESFPRHELYGLTSQIQRASVSVASNIAEGRGRLNVAEFRQFLGLTQGSLYELETQVAVAERLNLGGPERRQQVRTLSNEVSRMLPAFIQTLSTHARRTRLAASQSKLAARS